MTPIADMVERMLANNDPPAAIVAAIRAFEGVTLSSRYASRTSRDASRSVTQEQARIRALNYRNRKKYQQVAKANDVAAEQLGVTPNVTQSNVTAPLRDCLTSFLSSSTGEPLKKSKRDGLRARGTRLEPGTPLSAEHRAVIVIEGIQDPEKLWAEFVDYWSDIPGTRGLKLNWTGTLRNRCREVIKRGFYGNGTSNHRTAASAGSAQTGADAVLAGMGNIAARVRERQLAERQNGIDAAGGDDPDKRAA